MVNLVISPLAEENIARLSTSRQGEVRRTLQLLQALGVRELGSVKVSTASTHGYVLRTSSDVRITVLPLAKGTYLVDDVFTKAALPPGTTANSTLRGRPGPGGLSRPSVLAATKLAAKKASAKKAAAKKAAVKKSVA